MAKKLLWLLLVAILLATACQTQPGPPSPSEIADANKKNAEADLSRAQAAAMLQGANDKSKVAAAQAEASAAERDLTNAKTDTERRLANVEVETRTRLGQANVDAVALSSWADAQRKLYSARIEMINAELTQLKDRRLFELGQESEVEWDFMKRSLVAWLELPLAYLLGVFLAASGLMFTMYIRYRLTRGRAYVLVEPDFLDRLAAHFTHQALLTVVAEADGVPRAFVEVFVRGPNAWRSYALADSKASQIAETLRGATGLTKSVLDSAQGLPPDVAAYLTTLSAQAVSRVLEKKG